jgi:hypothetical protein
LRRGYKITYILTTGYTPVRQVVAGSAPMNSAQMKILIGYLTRTNFLRMPNEKSLDKQFTLISQSRDKMSDKPAVVTFGADKYKEALKAYGDLYKKGKRRMGICLVRGDGWIIRSASVSDGRRVLYRYQNLAYRLIGEHAQSLGAFKNFQLSEKALGIYTRREYQYEWRKVMQYKYAYRRRMNAFAKQIYAERAKLMKTNRNIMLDKVYYFSITMQFNIYNQWTRSHQPRGTQNQWIKTNQLQYPLKRFGDWVAYRTRWFMRNRNMRIGPEHSFIGNNKVLWSTASKSKQLDKATTIGVAVTTGVLKPSAPRNGVFVIGTVDGKVKIKNCANIAQCRKMYYAYYRSGVSNVPYGVVQGNRVILRRGTSYYTPWNGFRDGSAYYNMFGQAMMMMDKKLASAGSSWNFKSTGFKTQKLSKKKYYY